MLAPVGAALGAWLVLGAFAEIAGAGPPRHAGRGRGRCAAPRNLPRADWGKALAHAGLGVTIFGVAAITAWAVEDIRVVQPGETLRRRPLRSCASTRVEHAPRPELRAPRPPPSRCCAAAARSRRSTPRSASIPCRAWRRPRRRSTAASPATSTSRSATRSRTAAGRCAPTSSPSPTGSGAARC